MVVTSTCTLGAYSTVNVVYVKTMSFRIEISLNSQCCLLFDKSLKLAKFQFLDRARHTEYCTWHKVRALELEAIIIKHHSRLKTKRDQVIDYSV